MWLTDVFKSFWTTMELCDTEEEEALDTQTVLVSKSPHLKNCDNS